MTTTNTRQRLKPIEIDGHFKYACPGCGIHHWASFKEAKTKGFIIVCDCDESFEIENISGIDIKYKEESAETTKEIIKEKRIQEKRNKAKNTAEIQKEISNVEKKTLPLDILEKAVKMLVSFGYTKSESKQMLKNAFEKHQATEIDTLVKYSITDFGVCNV